MMKKIHYTSAITAMILLGSQAFAAENEVNIEEPVVIETVADAFKNGKVKGLLRYGAQHRLVKAYSALGGYLGYETAPLHNFSIGATFYTSNPFLGSNDDDRKGLGGLYEADGGQDSYHVLGEAFLKFQNDEHRVVIRTTDLFLFLTFV
jgi:hypothetical protein